MAFVARLIATGLGVGYFPIAPASFASAVVTGAYYFFLQGPTGVGYPFEEAIGILILLPLAIWSSHQAEKKLGIDAHPIVIDEVVGQAITLWMIPRTWPWMVAGLFVFRVFDIWKPLGARSAQELPGGWGVVVDDVLAGIYGLILLQVFLRFMG